MNLAGVMKDRARSTSPGSARGTLRSVLVITQVALAFVLLTGAGLLIRSFFRMQQADLGFDSTNVVTADLPISDASYPDSRRLNGYLRSIVASLDSLPGVRDVAITTALPLDAFSDFRPAFGGPCRPPQLLL
jgi:putative ABC transport system permease protein